MCIVFGLIFLTIILIVGVIDWKEGIPTSEALSDIGNNTTADNEPSLYKKLHKIEGEDLSNNIINLFDVKSYNVDNTEVSLYLHKGQTRILKYATKEKAYIMYKHFLDLEQQWSDKCIQKK